jgi:hypothetical protein
MHPLSVRYQLTSHGDRRTPRTTTVAGARARAVERRTSTAPPHVPLASLENSSTERARSHHRRAPSTCACDGSGPARGSWMRVRPARAAQRQPSAWSTLARCASMPLRASPGTWEVSCRTWSTAAGEMSRWWPLGRSPGLQHSPWEPRPSPSSSVTF